MSIAGRTVTADDLIAVGLLLVIIGTSLFSAFRLQGIDETNAQILERTRAAQERHDADAAAQMLRFRSALEEALREHDQRIRDALQEHERRQQAQARGILAGQKKDHPAHQPSPTPSRSSRPTPSPSPSPSCLPNLPICLKE